MSSELVGLPPPRERPDRPVPPDLAGTLAHGYNCRCVARHFGLDPAGYGEVAACALTAADYARLAIEADELHLRAKRLAARREPTAALELYTRLRQLAAQLDRTDLELGALSDLAQLCYTAGDLRAARQCADAVVQAAALSFAAMVHFGQFVERPAVEGSRDVAERTLISLATEDGDLDRARTLIAGQHERHPDDVELRIFEVRVLIAEADLTTARDRIDAIIAELTAAPADERTESLLAMAHAEQLRLRQDGGQDTVADLIRTSARLTARGDLAAAAKVDTQLAFAQAANGDLPHALRTIVESRDRLAAAGLAGDLAEASFTLGTILLSAGQIAQARAQFEHAGTVWSAMADTQGAGRLEFVLAQCDAAERVWESALARAERARTAARDSGAWLECVRADLLAAVVLHAKAHDPGSPVDRADTVRAALDLALPAALAADEYRFRFPNAAQRTAWAGGVAGPALELTMGMLAQLTESRLLAELVERTCAIGSFSESPGAPTDLTTFTTPPAAADDDRLPLAALATSTATQDLRLAPPPRLRWSPTSAMQLTHWFQLATDRYGLPLPTGKEVPTW